MKTIKILLVIVLNTIAIISAEKSYSQWFAGPPYTNTYTLWTGEVGIHTVAPAYPLQIYNPNNLTRTLDINHVVTSSTGFTNMGIFSTADNAGTDDTYGVYSYLPTGNKSSGVRGGFYTNVAQAGSGTHYGLRSYLTGGSGTQYGTYSKIDPTSNSSHFGSYNYLTGGGNGTRYGNYTYIAGTGGGNHYGHYAELKSNGNGTHAGFSAYLDGSGSGTHYGIRSLVWGTGNGLHYGIYSSVVNGTGTSYGVYSSAEGTTNYSFYGLGRGYFSDNVGIGTSTPTNKLDVVGNAAFTGSVGVSGPTMPGYALKVNASASYGGIFITDPVDNYVFYTNKSGAGYGIYVGKTNAASSSSAIFGYTAGTGSGIYGASASTGTGVYGYNFDNGYGVKGDAVNNYGVYAYSSGYRALYAEGNSAYFCAYFNGNTFSTGSYYGSDSKLKKNVKDFSNAMEIINKLQPKNYEFRNDGSYALMQLPKGSHYGLIAQDLEKVLPNLVKETSFNTQDAKPRKPNTDPNAPEEIAATEKNEIIDFKAVNYTELIPILVKALQEQEAKIEALSKELNAIKNGQGEIVNTQITNEKNSVKLSNASLQQNVPNPFNNATTISYTLPQQYSSAKIVITDNAGKILKEVNISGSGKGSLNIDASSLASGIYNYSLYIQGKPVETKQMVLTK